MAKVALSEIEKVVREAVARSTLADQVRDLTLEVGSNEDGVEFLRVIMAVPRPDKLGWSTLAPLTRDIEDEVSDIDERFPSIRLAEAA